MDGHCSPLRIKWLCPVYDGEGDAEGGNCATAAYTEILRSLREDHDMTQAQAAAALGTTQQVYARYEKGVNELPLRHLRALCLLYGVSADYILDLPEGLKRPR